MKTEVLNKFSRKLGGARLAVKKNSPELYMFLGFVTGGLCLFSACKATLEAKKKLDDAKADVEAIHDSVEVELEDGSIEKRFTKDYTEKDYKKELASVYLGVAVDLAKEYAPAVGWGLISATSLFASHNTLSKRNAALNAALSAVTLDYKGYRDRIIERFGSDLDRELKYDIKTKEVEEVVQNEDGTETTVVKNVEVATSDSLLNQYSPYARFYDASCSSWTKDASLNLTQLLAFERYANQKLKSQKYLFLNEVLEDIGLPKCQIGQIAGWIYDETNPDADSYISFGIFDTNKECNRDFVNGYEPVIILDFNCEGNILDKVWSIGSR